jgi:hypothetical protein
VLTGIDHIIIAVADPEAAANEIESSLGLRATGGGRHDAFGTFNRLVWLGDSFIEFVGVFDEDLARGTWFGSHIVGVLSEKQAAFAGLAFATNDLVADVSALHRQRSPILEPADGQRVRPDGRVVRWRVGRLPKPDQDLGLAFLIEHDTAAAEWSSLEREARAQELHPAGTPASLVFAELPVESTAQTTQRVHRQLGIAFRPSLVGGGARDSSIGTQTLRLVPGRAMPTFGLRAGLDSRDTQVVGCRWLVEPYRNSNVGATTITD